MLKILIGTPIHVCKDYSMERWLKSVSQVRAEYPADLLLVDNSPGHDYVEKTKGYCKKYGITDYKIKHLEIPQGDETGKSIAEQEHERIALSREMIRQEFLASDYDAYFFWENDILIPADSLGKLVQLMQAEDFMVVVHNCWIRSIPGRPNFDYGLVLFSRKCLEKYNFLLEGSDPEMPACWYEAEPWFRRRLDKDRCTYTEVYGLIEPVHHLDELQ